jgi:hypothetical protein
MQPTGSPIHIGVVSKRYRVGYAAVLCWLVGSSLSVARFATSKALCNGSSSATVTKTPSTKVTSSHVVDRCVELPQNGSPLSERTNIPQRLEDIYLKLDGYLNQHVPLKQGRWQDSRPQGVAASHLGGYKVNFFGMQFRDTYHGVRLSVKLV